MRVGPCKSSAVRTRFPAGEQVHVRPSVAAAPRGPTTAIRCSSRTGTHGVTRVPEPPDDDPLPEPEPLPLPEDDPDDENDDDPLDLLPDDPLPLDDPLPDPDPDPDPEPEPLPDPDPDPEPEALPDPELWAVAGMSL